MRLAASVAVVVALAGLAGADEAHFRVTPAFAARVETGQRSGLTVGIELDGRGPLVTVSQIVRPLGRLPAYPLRSPVACGDAGALEVPPSFTMPREAAASVAACRTSLDALVAVVSYVSRHVVLDEADRAPQDGLSVLRRGRGRCSGRANLAVGMLRAVGVPARVVHGVLFDGEQPRWHRWGEAWMGPLGWMPFDPGASAGVVSVRYLPCRAVVPGLQPQGVALEQIDEECFRSLPRRGGLATPLIRGVNLRCRAPEGVTDITAILVGPDGMRWIRRGWSEVAFDALQPGAYWLTWRSRGMVVPPVAVDLRCHGDVSVVLAAGRLSARPDGGTDALASVGGSNS